MASTRQSVDSPNVDEEEEYFFRPKEWRGVEEEEYYSAQLDDNTWLLCTVDNKFRTGGRLKQIDKDGKVKFFPLRDCQMEWIFQRRSLPSGCYEDHAETAEVPYPTYKTIKATKHGGVSLDLELLDSELPPFNLSHLAWFGMRHTLNDFYDWIADVLADFDCGCPPYTHMRIFECGYKHLGELSPFEPVDEEEVFPGELSCVFLR